MNYIYTKISKTGLVRSDNEDSIGVFKVQDGLLAVVCDGLGGNNAGEVASQLAVETVHKNFQDSPEDNYPEKIKSSVIKANTAIFEKAKSDSDLKGMSTTAEVLFIKDDKAYIGHVGDSRIYIFTGGKLKQVTKDHSFVQRLVDEGVLSEKEAEVHPNKNIITRALGDSIPVEVDLDAIKIPSQENLFFFMCTDGVSGVIDNSELEGIFRLNDMDYITKRIAELVEQRGAPDNFSFVLIKNDE
ncbi:MAG TPA: Stp1/IreP family PP2C-type Ser/Thr phosphatase [Ignavibacteriaceae bacterium]|nr:Stp1/IreP family PP2C-type Ser/Thr phosphatase [Ignavibacteriaceae bacterium]